MVLIDLDESAAERPPTGVVAPMAAVDVCSRVGGDRRRARRIGHISLGIAPVATGAGVGGPGAGLGREAFLRRIKNDLLKRIPARSGPSYKWLETSHRQCRAEADICKASRHRQGGDRLHSALQRWIGPGQSLPSPAFATIDCVRDDGLLERAARGGKISPHSAAGAEAGADLVDREHSG